MSELRKAAQMALEVMEGDYRHTLRDEAIDALSAALAQPEPIISPEIKEDKAKPVAYQWLGTSVIRKRIPKTAEADAWKPLYTAPPQRKPLTEDQIDAIVRRNVTITDRNLAGAVYMSMREVEAAHGIGGEE